jgi:hypothetical protein
MRPGHGHGAWLVLEFCDVFCLESFWTSGDRKFHSLALDEGFESFGLDGGVMHKNVISGGSLDESIAFGVVEPFYCPLFFVHILVSVPFVLLKLTRVALATSRQKRKRPQNQRFCGLPSLLYSVTKTPQALLVYTLTNYFATTQFKCA